MFVLEFTCDKWFCLFIIKCHNYKETNLYLQVQKSTPKLLFFLYYIIFTLTSCYEIKC